MWKPGRLLFKAKKSILLQEMPTQNTECATGKKYHKKKTDRWVEYEIAVGWWFHIFNWLNCSLWLREITLTYTHTRTLTLTYTLKYALSLCNAPTNLHSLTHSGCGHTITIYRSSALIRWQQKTLYRSYCPRFRWNKTMGEENTSSYLWYVRHTCVSAPVCCDIWSYLNISSSI